MPEGHSVTMPQLGMAQDTGLLVNWLKAPGDEVTAEDILFEVETDKSTMEVEAGRKGWLAATLAERGTSSEVTAASLARHTQTVLQGAFVLSKAANDPALVLEAIGHLRRYLECILGIVANTT